MSIVRLRWLYALQGAALGLLLPYLAPLLAGRGLSATEIGLVLGASGLVSLASYPMWGALADGRLGRRQAVAASALVAVAGGLWLAVAGSDPLALAAAVSVTLVGELAWGPITDALALASLGERSSSYGRLRAWASVGWAVSAIAAGFAWDRVGGSVINVTFALVAVAIAVVVLLPSGGRRTAGAPEDAGRTGPDAAGSDVAAVPRPGIRREWRAVLASPIILGFLAAVLITSIGVHASWRYVSLRILDQGGGALLVGLAAALPALVETPVFMASTRWARLLGLRWVYVAGALIASVLIFLIAFTVEPWIVAGLRALDGTSFALRHIGMVLIIGALLPLRLHAFGQSIGWLTAMGVAPIIADIGGGIIYDGLGSNAVFVVASMLALTGGAIAFLALAGAGLGRAAAGRTTPAASQPAEGEPAPVIVDR
jgi:MFS transporter, PPP family, 3-phenylpropionic acid transporter